MHGMVNITLSPKRYDIELRRRPIVSTANYDFLAQTQFAAAPSTRRCGSIALLSAEAAPACISAVPRKPT